MKVSASSAPNTKVFNTKINKANDKRQYQWWKSVDDDQVAGELIATVAYIKEGQQDRQRKAAVFARLYGNQSLFNFVGGNQSGRMDKLNGLPSDRPTMNVIQSATDTLISRISQNRPSPVFLTDNSDYKERRLAKQLNNFIQGEYYQTKAYEKMAIILRDALVEGTGILHVYEHEDGPKEKKVALERVLLTELFVDENESIYGSPRQIYRVKLIDRQVLINITGKREMLAKAEGAYPDESANSSKTVSDMVMVVEGWHLPSSKGAKDGRHTIACSNGILSDEPFEKDKFPFVFLHYSERLLGFWSQGLAEQLMGTQLEINSILYTISKSIKLIGVPKIFVESGSKVVDSHFTNGIGDIIKYQGVKPEFMVPPVVPMELYQQLQRMVEYAYQQCGVGAMQATGAKPAGLNSGEAQRVYDDIATDRFAALSRKYDNAFIDLAYLVIDMAMDICAQTGKYQTVYPNKNGTKQIDLPKMKLLKDPFVIQCFNTSALPRDPAGRIQKVTEWIQGGIISVKEGRRLMDFPDLEQVEKLANASEERIYQIMDEIVEDGKYTPPDPFMDLALANDISVQYYNLYVACKLEEDRAQMLRDFHSQVQALVAAATPPPMPGAPGQPGAAPATPGAPSPQANPEPTPTSALVPNAAGA